MASKNDDYYEDDDDDDEEDEGDFIPDGDDDDELDDDFEDENLEDGEDDEYPPFLQGHLYLDDGNAIVYDDARYSTQSFRLASEGTLPTSWSLQKPILENSFSFVGWVKDPSRTLKFKVGISKLDSSVAIDPLEQRLLDSQQEVQPLMDEPAGSKPAARAKGGDDDDEGEDGKQASLKAPSSSDGKKIASGGDVYVFEGSEQIDDKNSAARKIRGLFRLPGGEASRISLMVGVQMSPATGSSASPAAKAAPAAAAARKRGRGDDGEDDDDGDDGVGYQELIALHDDAGLSTDELRRRYYGGAAASSAANEPDSKKPKPNANDEDDDDDDAYGF